MKTISGLDADKTFEQDETNFNFAFGLYTFIDNSPIDLDDMKGYFEWNVYVVERLGVDGFKFENVAYHRCTEGDWKDNLYP